MPLVPHAETQFGQLPILEVDGVEIGQSTAIGRYLATEFGQSFLFLYIF